MISCTICKPTKILFLQKNENSNKQYTIIINY